MSAPLTQGQRSELNWICFASRPVQGRSVDDRSAYALERRGLIERQVIDGEERWVATAAGHAALAAVRAAT